MTKQIMGFITGLIMVVALVIMTGAASGVVGKYQPINVQGTGIAILDTQTGIVHSLLASGGDAIFSTIDLVNGKADKK